MTKEEKLNQLDMKQFNSRDLRLTSKVSKNGRHWYEFIRVPCPICGHTGNCIVNERGTGIICTRLENKHPYGSAWYYALEYSDDTNKSNALVMDKRPSDPNQVPIAKAKQLDKVYRLLLLFYRLSKDDFSSLQSKRCLSEETIKHNHYGTFLTSKKQLITTDDGKLYSVWRLLFKKTGLPLDSWKGVPGFYGAKMPGYAEPFPIFETIEGTLIPFRNADNLITGLQVRVHKIPVYIKDVKKQFKSMDYKIYASADGSFEVNDKLGDLITTGTGDFHHENTVQLLDGKLSFKMHKGAKYIWVTSVHKFDGCGPSGELGLPCQIDLDTIYQSIRAEAAAQKDAFANSNGVVTNHVD